MNDKKLFKSQEKVAFLSVITELPNLIAQIVFAILSGSLMLMLDVVDSTSNFIQAGMVYFLSKKLQGSDQYRYDYGMGKIEAFGGFFSSVLMFMGLATVFIVSVRALFSPRIVGQAMLLAIILKIINVSVDIFLLYRQKKTVQSDRSGLVKSNINLLKKNLIFDVVALFTIATSFLLRGIAVFAYLEPIICILCALYIAWQSMKILKASASDLLDKTLDEETQLKILKCFSGIWSELNEFYGIRTRRSGQIVYIDLLVSFHDNNSYSEIYRVYDIFDKAVKEVIPGSVSSIVIVGVKGNG